MLEFPKGQYKTIYIDPPWPECGGGKIKRGADAHYNLMSVKQIQELPVGDLAHPDGAHLYLWVTNNYLQAGLECIKAWGFEYKTCVTWMKDRQGLGQYYRGLTEHCLFAVTPNRLPYKLTEYGKRCQGVTGFYEAKSEHSRKPKRMREMIELVSYEPRIELFARRTHPGWDVWGDEVHICATCKWHENIDDGYVCVNDCSDCCTDWTTNDSSCDLWEAKT